MFKWLFTNSTEGPLSSLGIVGPLTGFITMAAGFYFGDNTIVTAEDVTTVTSKIDDMFMAAGALWGTVTAIIGRWRATKKIGGGDLA